MIRVIYEDNHLLVVEKPVNMLSQEDETGDPDMLTVLKDDIKHRYEKPGNVFLGLVHRLDRPVGGVMVFGRTSKAASRLSDQIRKREFEKTYLAVVNGSTHPIGCLEHFLEKDTATNTVRVVPGTGGSGKEAVLFYKTLKKVNGLSLVRIFLVTGRPHQIRVQFSTIGHPLLGDRKYGPEKSSPDHQLALWSSGISFYHPTTKMRMSFSCPPPDEYPWNLFA